MKSKLYTWPVFGIMILLIFLLLPPIKPLTPIGMKVVGIFLFTIIWWATASIGYTSILCIALFVMTGVMTPTEAFAASWGNWVVLFLIGVFGLSEGLKITGFSHRFALWFMTRPFTGGHPWMSVAMLLLACIILGSVMTSVATCVVFMAIAEPMLDTMGYKKGDRFAAMLMMGIAWAATACSIITPIAHPCNIVMIELVQRDFGYTISFAQWLAFGLPMGLLTYFVLLGAFRFVVNPDMSRYSLNSIEYLREEASRLGEMKLVEKLALGVLIAAIACWILPGIAGNIIPDVGSYLKRIGYAVPALTGASLLCFFQVSKQPTLTFQKWMQDGVEWNTMALVAAIMAIGSAIGNQETGISQLMTSIFQPLARSVPFYLIVLISLFWVVLQTNIMSNLVSTTIVYTIMMPVAVLTEAGNPMALGATIASASYFAFSLPSATAVTAIVIGSGWVSIGFMARYGFIFVIPIALLFAFVCYPLASLILH